MLDGLKPPTLAMEATPIEVRQWKKKFGTYYRRSGVPAWPDVDDKHNVFFGCMEVSVADKIMRHDLFTEALDVLPADPPTRDSLVELLDDVFLREVPLFNRRLEFWQMKQSPSTGESVDQFVELLEARAREAARIMPTSCSTWKSRWVRGLVSTSM